MPIARYVEGVVNKNSICKTVQITESRKFYPIFACAISNKMSLSRGMWGVWLGETRFVKKVQISGSRKFYPIFASAISNKMSLLRVMCGLCRLLSERIADHRRDVRNKNPKSATAMHTANSDHRLDLDNVKILGSTSNFNDLLYLEAAYIVSLQTFNGTKEWRSINSMWEIGR